MSYVDNILENVPVYISAIIAVYATVQSNKSLRIMKNQAISENANSCNERYCNIYKAIRDCITANDFEGYRNYCEDMIELLGHQFTLWRDSLLPDNMFLVWAQYNSQQLGIITYKDASKTFTFRNVWDALQANGKYQNETYFASYMECLFNKRMILPQTP